MGEMVCSICGIVISEKIQERLPEWRSFGDEVINRSRIGLPNSLARHDMGISTIIAKTNIDAHGNRLNRSTYNNMYRLREWHFRSQINSSSSVKVHHAFQELSALKDKLALSDAITEKTAYIYRKAKEKGLTRGRATDGILAAATYLACREMETPKTLEDIVTIADIKRKSISREYRLLVTELDLKIPLVDPMRCVAKIANRSDLSEKTKRKAITIMRTIITGELSAGKNPMSFAASVVYLASLYTGEKRNQTDIASAAGVTAVTLRNRYRDLKRILGLDSLSLPSKNKRTGKQGL